MPHKAAVLRLAGAVLTDAPDTVAEHHDGPLISHHSTAQAAMSPPVRAWGDRTGHEAGGGTNSLAGSGVG